MTRLMVTPDVVDAFGDLRVNAVTATGLDNSTPWSGVSARVDDLERAASDGHWTPLGDEHPAIASWHAAYRHFGTNPRRQRPSVDALGRRLARTGRLPRINPAVDSYNLVSVTHAVSVGAFDLDHVEGDITIRFAEDGDRFTPLGEPDEVEQPHAGEVVYADDAGVLTRHWNHRDADRTKVTPPSRRVLFVLETVEVRSYHAALAAAVDDLSELLRPHAEAVSTEVVDAARAAAGLPTP
jgi:DNA/RNA-binding domain of Phe-tRNA-synthetase-like protein